MNQSLRIAVAEDEPLINRHMHATLNELGHRVIGAVANGIDLVALCRETRPDLVITDIRMPGIDGLEAAARIYDDRPVPIIVVSAHYDKHLIERAERSHIQAYLVKPVQGNELQPTIAVARQRFQEYQQLHEALNRVRQLHGLLPICCYCKKIRNDQDYWQQVEAYIEQHTDARFSHGICPKCFTDIVEPELEQYGKSAESGFSSGGV
jgi:response regulator NasT